MSITTKRAHGHLIQAHKLLEAAIIVTLTCLSYGIGKYPVLFCFPDETEKVT